MEFFFGGGRGVCHVCTPTHCIGPISVSVPKKCREMGQISLKKWHIERAPSRWPSHLTFMAALQPSLYTYPVYRTYLCQCTQKVALNEADLPKKCDIERAPSRWPSPLTFMAASQQSLYTYPLYRTHLCQCSQKMA